MAKKKVLRVVKAPAEGAVVAEPCKFVEDTGLLWVVNVHFLHGLGLEMVCRDGVVTFVDHRSNPAVVYPPADWEEGRRRFDAYLDRVGNATMKLRKKLLGFVTQRRPS